MSERESYPHGVPCWVDNAWPEPEAGLRFYGAVFGWEFEGPGEMPGEPPGQYFVATLEGRDVAGISSLPSADPAPTPAWNTYVRVDSADRAAAAVRDAGGQVSVEPFDAPPAGRMAVVADPARRRPAVLRRRVRLAGRAVRPPRGRHLDVAASRLRRGRARPAGPQGRRRDDGSHRRGRAELAP